MSEVSPVSGSIKQFLLLGLLTGTLFSAIYLFLWKVIKPYPADKAHTLDACVDSYVNVVNPRLVEKYESDCKRLENLSSKAGERNKELDTQDKAIDLLKSSQQK